MLTILQDHTVGHKNGSYSFCNFTSSVVPRHFELPRYGRRTFCASVICYQTIDT
jgi:hypothetical protein